MPALNTGPRMRMACMYIHVCDTLLILPQLVAGISCFSAVRGHFHAPVAASDLPYHREGPALNVLAFRTSSGADAHIPFSPPLSVSSCS